MVASAATSGGTLSCILSGVGSSDTSSFGVRLFSTTTFQPGTYHVNAVFKTSVVSGSFTGSLRYAAYSFPYSSAVYSSRADLTIDSGSVVFDLESSSVLYIYVDFSFVVHESLSNLFFYVIGSPYIVHTANNDSFYFNFASYPTLQSQAFNYHFEPPFDSSAAQEVFDPSANATLSSISDTVQKTQDLTQNIETAITTTPPSVPVFDKKNQDLQQSTQDYVDNTDTSDQLTAITSSETFSNSSFIDFAASYGVTITFFSAIVASFLSSLGEFATPIMFMLTLVVVSTVLGVASHLVSKSERPPRDKGGG